MFQEVLFKIVLDGTLRLALTGLSTYLNYQQSQDKQAIRYETFDEIINLMNHQRYDLAIDVIDTYLQKVSIDLKKDEKCFLWGNKGFCFLYMQEYKKAIDCFDRYIAVNKNNEKIWFTRSCCLFNLDKYEESINSYEKALAINSCNGYAWHYHALCLSVLKRHKEATYSHEKALDIINDDENMWYYYALDLVNIKRYKKAINSFIKVVEINNNHEKIYQHILNCLKKMEIKNKDYDEYKDHYQRISMIYENLNKKEIDNENIWINLGDILFYFFYYSEFIIEECGTPFEMCGYNIDNINYINCYKKALKINTKNEYTWLLLGKSFVLFSGQTDIVYDEYNDEVIYLEKNKEKYLKEAIECYKKALEINPFYEEALICQAQLCFQHTNNMSVQMKIALKTALDLFNKILNANPNNQYIRYCIAQTLEEMKEFNESIMIYKDLLNKSIFCQKFCVYNSYILSLNIDINPEDGYIQSCIARCYMKLEQYDQALKLYQESLTLALPKEVQCITYVIPPISFLEFSSHTQNNIKKDIKFGIANCLMKLNNYKEASKTYLSVLEEYGDFNQIYKKNLAICFMEINDYSNALKYYIESSTEITQTDINNIYTCIYNLFIKLCDFDQAIEYFRQIKTVYEKNYNNHSPVKYNYYLVQSIDDHIQEFLKMKSFLDYSNKYGKELEKYEKGTENYEVTDQGMLLPIHLAVFKKLKDYSNMVIKYQNLLKDLGEFERSVQYIKRTVMIYPENRLFKEIYPCILQQLDIDNKII